MCGIAGWVSTDQPLPLSTQGIIKNMTASLVHRGPDAEGFWFSSRVALGHRRLIVVDPRGGEQPMVRERNGQRYVLVYNGELYNTDDLRKLLLSRGYQFFTRNSDTEALLYAYMEWGTECTSHLNGIFAFAIWDESKRRLFLARDRLGVKPLFYSQQGAELYFASEIKALLAHPDITPRLGRAGLADILVLGPARTPGQTPFADISELEPGYQLVFDHEGVKPTCYWQLKSHPHGDSPATTVSRVRELFLDAVTRQLVSDVPLGTLLSGGLDSSAITVIAAAHLDTNLATYSVDYADSEQYFQANGYETNLDRPWVERVSLLAGTKHHYEMIANEQLANALATAVKGHDLPGMTDIDTSLLLFCQQVKKGVTVALSGECADEVLGGYPWFHRPELINKRGYPWINYMEERASYWNRDIREWIQPANFLEESYQQTLEKVPCLAGENAEEARLRAICYMSITRFLPVLLDRKDRMSMLASLEVRVPFADHHLVEYVWNIPWSLKNWGGQAKGILRQALTGLLPPDVLQRPKTPYPRTHNPLYEEKVRAMLAECLANSESPLHGLLDTQAIKEVLNSGDRLTSGPWFGQLMGSTQLLAYWWQLDYWWREYGVRLS